MNDKDYSSVSLFHETISSLKSNIFYFFSSVQEDKSGKKNLRVNQQWSSLIFAYSRKSVLPTESFMLRFSEFGDM